MIGSKKTNKQKDTPSSLFSAPVISPTDISGYGGKNGEIIITWTVSEPYMRHLTAYIYHAFQIFYFAPHPS